MTPRVLVALLPLLVAFFLLIAASCAPLDTPDATVAAAVVTAQEGRFDEFLGCFTPASARKLAAFWSVSQRYGYLEDRSLRHLGDLEIISTQIDGSTARVLVRDDTGTGDLCLSRTNGLWQLDLYCNAEN